jgi:hypothetical protein
VFDFTFEPIHITIATVFFNFSTRGLTIDSSIETILLPKDGREPSPGARVCECGEPFPRIAKAEFVNSVGSRIYNLPSDPRFISNIVGKEEIP